MSTGALPRARPAQFACAAQALGDVLAFRQPADAILQNLFRERPQMGSHDRAIVGAIVYGVLRDVRRLQVLAGDDSAALCAAWLAGTGLDADALAALGYADAPALNARIAHFDAATLSDAQRDNLPDWLHQTLVAQYGAEETRALAQALNREGNVDLRVNTLRATREEARAALAAENLTAEPTALSPLNLRLPRRGPLQGARAFRDGLVEPQDEGSQLLSFLVAPRPGDTIVDYCAGAGGKTLALGALMNNQGRLFAFDVSESRLAKLAPREKRAGLRIVHTRVLLPSGEGVAQRRMRGGLLGEGMLADAVLVDAPCSSTGALRRNPELRLRIPDLRALQAQQIGILESASSLVRPGGVLVYATCSLAAEENEQVVEGFLTSHSDFQIEDAGAVLRAQGVAYDGALLKLLPHRHGTDGFFAARLRRNGSY